MEKKEYLEEFRALDQTTKEQVWGCVNNLYWLCSNCRNAQEKPFEANGVRAIYYSGWELGFGPDVLGNIKHMTSLALPRCLGERLDAYGKLHVDYSCDEAVQNINELREALAEIMRKNDNSDSKKDTC